MTYDDKLILIGKKGADKGSLAVETRGPSKLELECDYSKLSSDTQ